MVELVEVDPVGLHPAQRRLAGADDVAGGEEGVVRPVRHPAVDLGGQHGLLAALAALGEPGAEHLLGAALAGVEAVDVGGVEEVDALGERPVHDRVRVGSPRSSSRSSWCRDRAGRPTVRCVRGACTPWRPHWHPGGRAATMPSLPPSTPRPRSAAPRAGGSGRRARPRVGRRRRHPQRRLPARGDRAGRGAGQPAPAPGGGVGELPARHRPRAGDADGHGRARRGGRSRTRSVVLSGAGGPTLSAQVTTATLGRRRRRCTRGRCPTCRRWRSASRSAGTDAGAARCRRSACGTRVETRLDPATGGLGGGAAVGRAGHAGVGAAGRRQRARTRSRCCCSPTSCRPPAGRSA